MSALKMKKLRSTVKVVVDGVERYVELLRGQALPDNLAQGELERLQRRNAVTNGAGLVNIGEPPVASDTGGPPVETRVYDVTEIGSYTDEELASMYAQKPPTVKALLAAVGDDKELATRVLRAETSFTKGDPRVSLKAGLDKVVAGDEAS